MELIILNEDIQKYFPEGIILCNLSLSQNLCIIFPLKLWHTTCEILFTFLAMWKLEVAKAVLDGMERMDGNKKKNDNNERTVTSLIPFTRKEKQFSL